MKCLVVTTHPLRESLCMSLSSRVVETLLAAGHEVVVKDLYKEHFQPALTEEERKTYYGLPYEHAEIKNDVAQLLEAEAIGLVFPTWWFSVPAVLKGWFDRVWGPGIAYDHASDYGPIKPRLNRLRRMFVVTTLGAPWWVDHFIMRQPVKKVLKNALLGACAPKCKFRMFSLYKAENIKAEDFQIFFNRINRTLRKWD